MQTPLLPYYNLQSSLHTWARIQLEQSLSQQRGLILSFTRYVRVYHSASAHAPPYVEAPRIFKVASVYRSKLRDDIQGIEGDEIARQRVEDFVNRMRPSGILVSTSSKSRY